MIPLLSTTIYGFEILSKLNKYIDYKQDFERERQPGKKFIQSISISYFSYEGSVSKISIADGSVSNFSNDIEVLTKEINENSTEA